MYGKEYEKHLIKRKEELSKQLDEVTKRVNELNRVLNDHANIRANLIGQLTFINDELSKCTTDSTDNSDKPNK